MEQDTSEATFPVVGVGTGVEGLPALQTFVAHVPPESGIAFVLIVHPAPMSSQKLVALLQTCTSLPVVAAQGPVTLAPNQIVVIPSDRQPELRGEALDLPPADPPDARLAPIDRLFGALAERYADRAGAVVLAGGGSDGALGIQQIKERGGLALAQEPREAEADAMPRAALATGMVDLVRPVADLPKTLAEYWGNAWRIGLPAEIPAHTTDQTVLRDILAVLRARTGHDIASYKRATVLHRIGRRMHLSGADSLPAYFQLLRAHPEEAPALLRDLLIGVTSFFRDPPVWRALRGIVPQLFAEKRAGDQLRVWVAGCASGAEAYSLAMLLLDHARSQDAPPTIQVFATDIDEEAIAKARQGRYPPTIAADVPPAYLQRFFRQEQSHYRVGEELREVVLFAVHDLLHDPPFLRLDLVSCRNLLIYLDPQAQERVLSLFHFSMQPGGYLLLGTAETADAAAQRFAAFDIVHRLYQRRSLTPSLPPMARALPLADRPNPARLRRDQAAPSEARSLSDLSRDLLAQYGPPSVIVNESFDILHLGLGAGRFLQLRSGEPSYNLLQLIHPRLRLGLRPALFEALQGGTRREVPGQPIELEGTARLVSLVVQPIGASGWIRGALLVLFYDQALVGSAEPLPASSVETLVHHVEDELERTQQLLRVRVEQYETVVEEYRSTNEELQALNEELQTSKEQFQALNEELLTLNSELRHKVGEQGQTNNDLQNLIAATAIPTLFVDRRLLITRYTPAALEIFNLIAADLYRPLGHITHRLDYPALLADARLVLTSAVPVEREVRDNAGRHYLARLLPYRTSDDEADGVVLSFVDITARKRAEEAVAADLRDTRMLRDLAVRLTSEADIQVLYDQILNAAILLTGADAGSIQRYDEQAQELVLLWAKHLPADMVAHFGHVGSGPASSWGISLATGERTFVDFDVPDLPDPEGALRMHREAGLVSAQSTPLVARSARRIGMVSTYWRVRHRPTERELRFLDLLARQAADLLDQRQAEEALRAGQERQAYLVRLGDALQPLDSAEEITATAAHLLGKLLRADQVSYVEVEPNGAAVVPQAQRSTAGYNGVVVRNAGAQGPLVIADTEAAETERAAYRASGVRALIAYPLLRADRLVAVLGVSQATPRAWTAEEVELVRETAERTRAAVERAHAEAALRASEALLHAIANLVPDLLWSNDPKGVTHWYNQRWLDYTGQTFEQARDYGWLDTIHPDDRAGSLHNFQTAVDQGRSLRQEHRICGRDGVYRWFLVRAEPVRDEASQIVRWYGAATDIDEIRSAEATLRESEARFRLMADTLPQLIWLADAEGRVEFFNRRWSDYAGVPYDPATVAETAARFVHPEDAPRVLAAFEQARRTGSGFEVEQRNRSASGEYRWFLCRAEPYRDPDSGLIVQWFGVGIDIHDRKRITANLALLADFSERLAALSTAAAIMRVFGQQIGVVLGASSCAFLEIEPAQDEAVVIEHWLRGGTRPAGARYRLADYLGDELRALVAAGQPVIVRDVAADARIRDTASFVERRVGSFVNLPLFRDGEWRFMLGVYHERPYDWRDDEIALLLAASERIWHKLERVRAEAALRESEARFRLLVEGARDYAMFLLDPDGQITFWSSGATRVFGWSEAEARGQSSGLIFTPEDRAGGEHEREMQTASREGRALDRRWHIRKDGSRLFVDGALIRLDDERGSLRGFVKIGRDATAQRQAEEALQRARDELECRVAERTADLAASNQALQQEIAERRQVEAERAALMERIITAQEDERGRIARELHDSLGQFLTALSVRLTALRNQAAGLPAIHAGLDELRRVAGQLDQELDRLTVELRPPALDDTGLADALSSYTAEWSTASGVPVDLIAVKLDDARLPAAVETTVYRIVQEALTNVLKHAQATLVSVILERRPDALRVIIEDNGGGFTVEAAPPERAAGRRLGLLGMRERASLAGGTLKIESTPGQGTSIFVSIPLEA